MAVVGEVSRLGIFLRIHPGTIQVPPKEPSPRFYGPLFLRQRRANPMANNKPACIRHPEITMLGFQSPLRLNFGSGTIENVQWKFTCAECGGAYSANTGYLFGCELVGRECPVHPTIFMFTDGGKFHCPIEGCVSA